MQWHLHQGDVRHCHATRMNFTQYTPRTCARCVHRTKRHDGCSRAYDGKHIHVRALPSDPGPRSPAMQQHSRFTAQYKEKLQQLKPMMTPEAISYLRETLPQQELADLEQLLSDIAATASWEYDVQAADDMQAQKQQEQQEIQSQSIVQQSAEPPSDFYSYLQQVVFPGLDDTQLEEVIDIMGRETLSSIAEWYEELVAFQKQKPDPQLLQAKYEELSKRMAQIMQQIEAESSESDTNSSSSNHNNHHRSKPKHRLDSRPAQTTSGSPVTRHDHNQASRSNPQFYNPATGQAEHQQQPESLQGHVTQETTITQTTSFAIRNQGTFSDVSDEQHAAITSQQRNEEAIGPHHHHTQAHDIRASDQYDSALQSANQSSVTSQLISQGATRGRETGSGTGRTQFEWLIKQPASVSAEWTWDLPMSTNSSEAAESRSSSTAGSKKAIVKRETAGSQGTTLLARQRSRRKA